MFTNRFFTVLVILALTAVAGLTVREAIATSSVTSNVEEADAARWEAMGEYHANQAAAQPMDSATRSYIAWGEALEAAGHANDPVVCTDTSQEIGFDAEGYTLDSATRSYIAWGQALEAARNAKLDSATRSYIAWGQALQAKDDIRALCR